MIGQQAAGKTVFAKKLGERLAIPVVHLDAIVNGEGRDKARAGELIRAAVEKPDWIMDGNAFTSDRNARLERADHIFLFTSHPAIALARHVRRWARGESEAGDGRSEGLHLGFAANFAFVRWPKREREIVADAHALGKNLILVKNRRTAEDYVKTLSFMEA